MMAFVPPAARGAREPPAARASARASARAPASVSAPSSFTPAARLSLSAPLRPRLPHIVPRVLPTPPRHGGALGLRASAAGGDTGSEPAAAANKVAPASASTLRVAFYIFLWYAFNIVYNISNKKVLNWFPAPWFVSWFQLLVGVLYVFPMWFLGLRSKPRVPASAIRTLLPVSVAHVVGHVGTVVSLGAVAVSFTHVVKSLEPFVNVLGSAVFLRSVFPLPVYMSLLPIVGGVIMASVSEVSFNWPGFLSAMTSNFAFTARNIFSKISMNEPKGENMGPANLFAVLSIISTIILAPVALFIDNPWKLKKAWQAATTGAAAVVSAPKLLAGLVISGLFFYLYQEVAFKALDSVHPVTHAVANTVKRVVIIVTSVIVFQNPVTRANAAGSTIALLGVLLYSIMKNYFPEKKRT